MTIVYISKTGFTAEYAKLLSEKTGLKAMTLPEANKTLPEGSDIIYLGWIMASMVKDYHKAVKKFSIKAVCGVGMGTNGSQINEMRNTNKIPETTPLFSLQGGYAPKKLKGIYKFMMNIVVRSLVKNNMTKLPRTAEDDDLLDLMLHGGSRVKEENLEPVIKWINEQKNA